MIKHKLLLPAQFYTTSWNNQTTTRKLINESVNQHRQSVEEAMTEDIEQQAKDRDCSEAKSKWGCAMAADWGLCRAWQFESFSTSAHTEKTRQNPADFLNWEDGTEGPETMRTRIFRTEEQRRNFCRKRETQMPAEGPYQVCSQELISGCLWGNYLKVDLG